MFQQKELESGSYAKSEESDEEIPREKSKEKEDGDPEEEDPEEEESENPADSPIDNDSFMTLRLGDIVQLRAPTNELLHENTFFIEYIDDRRIVLIDVASLEQIQLSKDENGEFTDQSITEVILISRSELPGYARQNQLTPGTWIEVYIGGDVSTIITGEITNLEEDQIEIRTIPDNETIYIDFEYKGIPEHIPIKKIVIRDPPSGYSFKESKENLEEEGQRIPSSEPRMEYLETGEVIIHADEEAEQEENVLDILRADIAKSKEVIFGEDLEDVEQFVDLPENKRRYGLDLQTSSLLDELLSTVPSTKRTQSLMSKIHTLIARFRELRNEYSLFDENGEVNRSKRNNPQLHKPLVERIQAADTKIDWILPVVSVKKKVYVGADSAEGAAAEGGQESIMGDTVVLDFDSVYNEEEQIKKNTYYNERTFSDESKYYKVYQQLADFMRPFEDPAENPRIMVEKDVRTALETIVDNYDEFYSSVSKNGDINKRRYVIQKYDLGLNKRKLVKSGAASSGVGRDIVETVPLTKPDKMCIQSIVTFPDPVIQLSRAKLPESSILEKSNMSMFPILLYKLLKKNKTIAPFVINSLADVDMDGEGKSKEGVEGETEDNFLTTIQHFVLSDMEQRVDEDDKFAKFLQAVVPKTRTLIRLLRKHIVNKLSLVSVVQQLEPFYIYTDDISYKQYLEIRSFIMDQIHKKKETLDAQRKIFGYLATYKYNIETQTLSILRFLLERPEFNEQLFAGYQLLDKDILQKGFSTYEILDKILKIDNGVLLTVLLQNLMVALHIPKSLAALLQNDPIDDMTQDEKIKAEDCHKRVLTKKYKSLGGLSKDNNKEIYYDKEYDNTPYHLLDKYKDDRAKMEPEKFVRFFAENLVQKHGANKEDAEELARTIIRGKKPVVDGDHAIVVIIPDFTDLPESFTLEERRRYMHEGKRDDTTHYYFYRKNDVWIRDPDLDAEAFMPTSELLCNSDKKCMTSPSTDSAGPQCLSIDEEKRIIQERNQTKIRAEFDQRFELASDDMKAGLHIQLADHLKKILRWMRIQSVQRDRANNIAYHIGLEATKYTDAVISPHLGLRDRILGRLYDQFCREPLELLTEDMGWKYCKMTNTKLLPSFLYDLAKTFVSGGNYQLRLEEICHTHGLLSDAGDTIVDKHSGFTVRAIDFATDEGYDESGFKITTHAFLQKGEVEKAVENIMNMYTNKDQLQVCESDRSQMICDLLIGISSQIGHSLTDIRDVCVRISSALCDQLIDTEEKYNKEAKKAEEKKGIKLPPYKKRSQQLTLLITASVLFMTIQTETPAFQTTKTMPGCVKSFKGYPLTGEEDTSGILYMACVLSKMEKKMEPWNTLERLTTAMIHEQMKKIATVAMKHAEMDARYLKKREYALIHEDEDIPLEHSISKWFHFLPPLIPYSYAASTVGPDFTDNFMSAIRKGGNLMGLQSKIAELGFSLMSDIQKIVKNKELILVGAGSGTPYLQNVCCNDKGQPQPILYFNEEDDSILKSVKTIKLLSKMLRTAIQISKPAILFDPRDRNLKYPPISIETNETNIYAAFIYYCQLDKGLGVPSKYHTFMTDIPVGYPAKATLDEKIEFLKRHEKTFSLQQFKELMQIVHKGNIISMEKPAPYVRSEVLKDIMLLFDNYASPVIDKQLRENIYRVLLKYDKTKLVTLLEGDQEDADKLPEQEKQKIAALRVLKNSLADMIQGTFKPSVIGFLKKYGKMGKRDLDHLTQFMSTVVSKWATQSASGISGDLYKTTNFIKNAVYEMTCVFPNVLITNVRNVTRIHKYWGLADVDSIRIYHSMMGYYEPLGEFREDATLRRLLSYIQHRFLDLRLFFDNLPIQEPIRIGSHDYFSFFDRETIQLLLEYVFLSVLHEYIVATDDPDLLRLDQIEKKRGNRAAIAAARDVDTQFSSEYPDLAEEYREVYGDMTEIQIQAGNRDELKTRVAKLLLAFITITRKNKAEIDISYENISAAIRKRKDKEKARIIERFRNMSEDERRVEDQKKKLKLDEWNVGTQKGIFIYDKQTSTREVREQEIEERLDIQKHGIRQADFVEIHGDEGGAIDDPLQIRTDTDQLPDEEEAQAEDENIYTGIGSIKKNFFDGEFYSDDESGDEFGDDV
jgi:hypothetical protein